MRVFVSHAGRDRAWAEWVAWQLEHAGWDTTVELDCWDWQAGDNFVAKMTTALDACDRTAGSEYAVADRAELLLDLARVEYLGGHMMASVATSRRAADEGERTARPEVVARRRQDPRDRREARALLQLVPR